MRNGRRDWTRSTTSIPIAIALLSFAGPIADGTLFPVKRSRPPCTRSERKLARLDENEQKAILADIPEEGKWRGLAKYSGRPLVGVWATAPYLHNGSVPTLDDLLKKAVDRPPTFHVGTREFDVERLGYRQDLGLPKNFDTTQPGNSKEGHEYGGGLDADQRQALLEYLKTL